jgi:hypothetical protein
MLKKYIDYLRDNPRGYWFKAKPFGWGWTPARWQGWVTLLVFMVLVIGNYYRLDEQSRVASDLLRPFVIQTIILAALLVATCWKKGERPHWMWGIPKKDPDTWVE